MPQEGAPIVSEEFFPLEPLTSDKDIEVNGSGFGSIPKELDFAGQLETPNVLTTVKNLLLDTSALLFIFLNSFIALLSQRLQSPFFSKTRLKNQQRQRQLRLKQQQLPQRQPQPQRRRSQQQHQRQKQLF